MKKKIYTAVLYGILHIILIGLGLIENTITRYTFYLMGYCLMLLDVALLMYGCIKPVISKCAKDVRKWLAVISYGVLLLGGIFIWVFLSNDHELKQFDSTVYWIKVIRNSWNLSMPPLDFLRELRYTLSGEYSDLAAIPLIPLSGLFGNSFSGYGLAIYILYYAPTCVMAAFLVLRLFLMIRHQNALFAYSVALVFSVFMPALILPVLIGYVDIVGVFIALMLIHISMNKDLWEERWYGLMRYVILSVLLVFTRRWYSFFIVAFYFSIGVDWICKAVRQRKMEWKSFARLMLNLVLIAGICAVTIWFFSPEGFKMLTRSDYGTAYSAYKIRSWFADAKEIWNALGNLMAILGIIGMVFMLMKRDLRYIAIRLVIMILVSFALFTSIQSMGRHHQYLILMHAVVLSSVGLVAVLTAVNRNTKIIGTMLAYTMIAIGFLQSYGGYIDDHSVLDSLFSNIHYAPTPRSEYAVLLEVKDFIKHKTESGKTFYICSNHSWLSGELFQRSELPERIEATPNMIESVVIDQRDGFPSRMFLSDFIVVGLPLELNGGEGQEVIRIPVKLLQDDPLYREVYESCGVWQAGEKTFIIYEKKEPITVPVVEQLVYQLQEVYPEIPYIWTPDYYTALLNIDNAQNIDYEPWEILAYRKPGELMNLHWQLDGNFTSIEIPLINWDNGLHIKIYADGECIKDTELPYDGQRTYTFDVTGVQEICVSISETNGITEGKVHLLPGILK